MNDADAFRYAIGIILGEQLDSATTLAQVKWQDSAGAYEVVESGLYRFQADTPYEQWSELLSADIFVDIVVDAEQFQFAVHTSTKSSRGRVDHPYTKPKVAIANLVQMVFEQSSIPLPGATGEHLSDPETQKPSLFMTWAAWGNFVPNRYSRDEDPWKRVGKVATDVVKGDPNFKRGMSWALPILLRPVAIPNRAGKTRPINPPLFDQHVLSILDSRFADNVINGYNTRLRSDKHLLNDALGTLRSAGDNIDITLDAIDDDNILGIPSEATSQPRPTSSRVRRSTCLALAGIRNRNVIDTLISVLASDPDATVRTAAATALGQAEATANVLDGLVRAIGDDNDDVRLAVVHALATLKQYTSPALEQAAHDRVATVRQAAYSVRLNHAPSKDIARQRVVTLLADDDVHLRVAALNTITDLFTTLEPIADAVTRSLSGSDASELIAALRVVDHFSSVHHAKSLPALFKHADPHIRAAAAAAAIKIQPDTLKSVITHLEADTHSAVQVVLLKNILEHGVEPYVDIVERALASSHSDVRKLASDGIYSAAASTPRAFLRAMLADASMRTNLAALRRIRRAQDTTLNDLLVDAVDTHPNEYVRAHALMTLDAMDSPMVRNAALRGLNSSYFIVRLFAAGILSRRATPTDTPQLDAALNRVRNPWLKLPLEDALARSRGDVPPERIRLNLGQRRHTEGGEIPAGLQLWDSKPPKNDKEARRMVDAGYRFQQLLQAPKDRKLWGIHKWNNSKGARSRYLVHVLEQLDKLDNRAKFTDHIYLFDEPHTASGGTVGDRRRSFYLEMGRPDLLNVENVPSELGGEWTYYHAEELGELSNWVMQIMRLTLQRKYPDIKLYPMTMSYMRNAAVEVYDWLDTDGDYSWRYDNHNLLGHYGKGAVMRAIHPTLPAIMITTMGAYTPRIFHTDVVYTDTTFKPGPWIMRAHMGTRAALACYASGMEIGYFNVVGYASMANRKRDVGGVSTFPLTPWSPALTATINRMIAGDSYYWKRTRSRIETEVMSQHNTETSNDDDILSIDADDDAELLELDDTGAKRQAEIEARYKKAVDVHFMNAMIGCSWMNIFNADNSRAMSNLPKPDNSTRSTLVILPRGSRYDEDAPAFPTPAMALADGFDLLPNYQCATTTDFSRYDTIMILAGNGVTQTIVNGLNTWLKEHAGLLIVNGALTSKTPLLPTILDDNPTESFIWEDEVEMHPVERVVDTYTDKKGNQKTRYLFPVANRLYADGTATDVPDSRLRTTYSGKLSPIVRHDTGTVLAQWSTARIKGAVLFDGIGDAGPAYTKMLEAAVLAVDNERGATVRRNQYWGHVGLDTDEFVIDVAGSGYTALHKARPRQHRGIDIIYGVINPVVDHGTSTMILKNYVGPYAGGLGDWAVMARTALVEMTLVDPRRLKLTTEGVVRVTHIGEQPIRLEDASGLEEVEGQLDVWKAMWAKRPAWSRNAIPGGWELHYQTSKPVTIIVD